MSKFSIAAALAGCLLAAPVLAADPSAAAAAPTVSVGDSWTWQYTDVWKHTPGNLNRTEVTAVDANGVQVEIKRASTGAVLSSSRFSTDMNPVDRGKIHFAP